MDRLKLLKLLNLIEIYVKTGNCGSKIQGTQDLEKKPCIPRSPVTIFLKIPYVLNFSPLGNLDFRKGKEKQGINKVLVSYINNAEVI